MSIRQTLLPNLIIRTAQIQGLGDMFHLLMGAAKFEKGGCAWIKGTEKVNWAIFAITQPHAQFLLVISLNNPY